MAEVKAPENEQKTSTKKVTGSRYIVTKNGNHLNLLVHESVKDGKNPCTYIYTDKDGNYCSNPFEIQNGKPINQKEWGWALSKWTSPKQVQMTKEDEVKVKAAVIEREKFLELPVAERFKLLPAKK